MNFSPKRVTSIIIFSLILQISASTFAAVASLKVSKDEMVIRSASELDYPPFSIIKPDGTADGFSVELLKAASEAVGFSITFRVGPWHELKQELADNLLDVLPLMSYSEQRDEWYDFTAPYLKLNGTVFVRKKTTDIHNLSDLKDKEIIVMRGDTAHEYAVNEKLSDNLILTDNYVDAFELLSSGKHDAIVVQQIVGLQIIKKLGLTNIAPVQKNHIETLKPKTLILEGFQQKFCFAVPEGHQELLSLLNEGLAATYVNGTYDSLYDKWFSPILPKPQVSAREVIEKSLFVIVPTLLFFALFSIWYLQRIIAQKTRYLRQEIRQRQLTESELEEANNRYKKAQQMGRAGHWFYDIHKQAFWGSEQAKKIYGLDEHSAFFTPEEVESCIPDRKRVHRALVDLIESGRPYNLEFEILTRDQGEHRFIHSIAELVKSPNGEPVRVEGVIQDITERKRFEETIQESEERFRLAVTNSPIPIMIHDDNDRVLMLSDGWTRLSGYNLEDIPTVKEWTELAYGERTGTKKDYIDNLFLIEGPVYNGEWSVRAKDGSIRIWEFQTSPLGRVNKGNRVLLSSANDITERKAIELALQESEDLFKSLFEDHSAIKLVINPVSGMIFDANQAAADFYGWTRDNLKQMSLSQIFTESSDSLDFVLNQDSGFIAHNRLEFVHRRADGSFRNVEVTSSRITTNDRTLLYSIIHDITDRKEIEVKLQQSQKMEAIGTLAGGIAHDFNNILAAILGYSEMALDDCHANSPLKRDIEQIIKAGQRARDLVSQILAFSRQDKSERIILKPETIVRETLKLLRSTLPTTIAIKEDIEPDLGLVVADPTQLHQVMMNICTNAYHAMEENGGTLTISMQIVVIEPRDLGSGETVESGPYIKISISDTGEGIETELINKIFDPYFTTKEPGKGTGMGLAIVHGIIESYGGFIRCDSQKGKGTTFKLFIPAVDEKPSFEQKKIEMTPVGTEHILFVDDEGMIAEMSKMMLGRLGYTVTLCEGGFEALDVFKKQPDVFNLVITDQTMPGMTGVELSQKLLKIRSDLPIIICTGYSSTVSEESAMQVGIKGFAKKPVIKKEIATLIRTVLDNAPQR